MPMPDPSPGDGPFSVPVLCYHGVHVDGRSYETSDRIALQTDLRLLAGRGYRVVSPMLLATVLRGEMSAGILAGKKLVALTFDDGSDMDYRDWQEAHIGYVPSVHAVLEDSIGWLPQLGDGPRGVAFVIASPKARAILDRTCYAASNKMNDDWWQPCAARGVLGIANHSWDHVHDTLPEVRQRENKKGSFFEIATIDDASGQIAAAQDYIRHKTQGLALPLFAYPYGHVSPYLHDTYFPGFASAHGLLAAFGTSGQAATNQTSIWNIPRFVCGEHWRSAQDFSALIDDIGRHPSFSSNRHDIAR